MVVVAVVIEKIPLQQPALLQAVRVAAAQVVVQIRPSQTAVLVAPVVAVAAWVASATWSMLRLA
jgi:hypothetical protein